MWHKVVAALIIKNNKILLGRRSPMRADFPNVWDMFGGHLEAGETYAQALVRELREGLGITPSLWSYIETHTIPAADVGDGYGDQFLVHLCLVSAWSGSLTNREPHEHTSIQWFSLSEALQLELAHATYPQLFTRFLSL